MGALLAQQIFDWLAQSKPPVGFTGYEYPEAGDVRNPADADPANINPNITPYEGSPEDPHSAQYDDQGRMTLPGDDGSSYYEDAPAPNVVGNEAPVDSWDYSYEVVPVYAVPPELGGGEYVGPLKYAPSLPQNLQPVRYVKVPRMERMT